jgi:ferredoxin
VHRIEIDRSLCSAYGTCIDLAPDLIELDDDLVAVALVAETDAPAALEAARGATRLRDADGSRSRGRSRAALVPECLT